MSRLIIVSNRVALPHGEDKAGGLGVALQEALAEGEGLWFGWSGQCAEEDAAPVLHRYGGATYATIDLPESDQREFYSGFSNGMLWPLFHYCPGRSAFQRKAFHAYLRVNETFARHPPRRIGRSIRTRGPRLGPAPPAGQPRGPLPCPRHAAGQHGWRRQ